MAHSGGWEEQLFAVFDDLEQQAEGLYAAERQLEVAERAAAEYAAVSLASRLMASVDQPVTLDVDGLGRLDGVLRRVARGWCLVESAAQPWIVRLPAVSVVRGASTRSVPEEAWPVTARLGFGSALRRLAEAGPPCLVVLADGVRLEARVLRVGQDFVELRVGDAAEPALVGFEAISAVTDPA